MREIAGLRDRNRMESDTQTAATDGLADSWGPKIGRYVPAEPQSSASLHLHLPCSPPIAPRRGACLTSTVPGPFASRLQRCSFRTLQPSSPGVSISTFEV
jgi:hypothetical protein